MHTSSGNRGEGEGGIRSVASATTNVRFDVCTSTRLDRRQIPRKFCCRFAPPRRMLCGFHPRRRSRLRLPGIMCRSSTPCRGNPYCVAGQAARHRCQIVANRSPGNYANAKTFPNFSSTPTVHRFLVSIMRRQILLGSIDTSQTLLPQFTCRRLEHQHKKGDKKTCSTRTDVHLTV